MLLHGSGIYNTLLSLHRKTPSPEHSSNGATRTDTEISPQVLTDVPAVMETATAIATAIVNAIVDNVPVVSEDIPASVENPPATLDIIPDEMEIVPAVNTEKGTMMEFRAPLVATPRRKSTRIRTTTKPRAKYATKEDLDSVLGPLKNSGSEMWRKQRKHKVTSRPQS